MPIASHLSRCRLTREVADHVAFMSGGSVTEEGPADEHSPSPSVRRRVRFLRVTSADNTTEVPV
jgi:polar amino acid transport system permease protein